MDAELTIYQDKRNQYRWRLRAKNTKIIAASTEGYKNRKDCTKNIKAVLLNPWEIL
jgi:uncharacterized protein YegP (UPF0339 family)